MPGPRLALTGAVFEIEARPGLDEQVGRALADLPQVFSVYLTSGEFDVYALVFAGDMAALSALLLEEVPRVPGAARVRSHLGLEWHGGVHWRLGAISSGQRASVTSDEPGTQGPVAERTRILDDAERDLYLALQRDGRAGHRELAHNLNCSEKQVQAFVAGGRVQQPPSRDLDRRRDRARGHQEGGEIHADGEPRAGDGSRRGADGAFSVMEGRPRIDQPRQQAGCRLSGNLTGTADFPGSESQIRTTNFRAETPRRIRSSAVGIWSKPSPTTIASGAARYSLTARAAGR